MTAPLLAWRIAAILAAVLPTLVWTSASPATASSVATVTCDPIPADSEPPTVPLTGFSPIVPQRLVDTRTGLGGSTQPLGAGCTLRLDMTAADIAPDADAFALSLTAISADPGFLAVHPCAGGRRGTSNLNTRAGFPTPNLAIARPDADGRICVFSSRGTDLLVDVTGWWTVDGASTFTSVHPKRVDDTRQRPGRAPIPANATHVVELADEVPEGTTAIVANLTMAEPADRGFAVAFPCTESPPETSNVNTPAGQASASAIIVGVDSDRRLCIRTNVDAHVIVDLAGYYATDQFGPEISFLPVAGTRLADSRDGTGGWTGPFTAGTTRRLAPVAGRVDAARATAVAVNVVATGAATRGFVQLSPCDGSAAETSVVNFTTDGSTSNLAIVELATDGALCVFASRQVDVVVDLFGVLTAPADALVERLSFGTETWPPYSTDGSDYAVRCAPSAELELDLLAGTTALVNGVQVQAGTIELSGVVDTLTSVRLSRGGTSTTHWFRCVPDDFPRVDVERSGSTAPGWYLTMLHQGGGASHSYATIMDARGAPIWYRATDPGSIELRLGSDGLLVGVAALGPRYGVDPDAGYERFTLTGDVVETVIASDEGGVEHPTDHHDLVDLPGGGSALLTYPLLGGQDLSPIGFGSDDTIADNVIQELDAAGTVTWSWRASDHFFYEEATYAQRFPPVPGVYEGDEVDVWHINSLDRVDGGDYVASARHLDAVFRIDHATGEVEWVVGPELPDDFPTLDPAEEEIIRDRRLQIVDDPLGGPRRQHDARLEGDVLTMLDNRRDTGQPARAVAYRIDAEARTATMLWQIPTSSDVSSGGLGSYRVADDGSSLVSWGSGPTPMFEEFDSDRNSVLRFFHERDGFSYRITKEPLSTFTAAVLRATAGGTIG